MWRNIGRFLEKFANFRPSKTLIKEESAQIIGGILGVEIKSENLEERDGILFLKTANPALKNEIFLKKSQILEALKEKLGPNAPRDIRF
ncbi:MAG: DciA family protein [Candidatus Parcubacteria bacterium]|nr:DciA family protein [Candidatus Parcubacteria bacterium]